MCRRIRFFHLEKGFLQKNLADMISVSQQSINKYENHNTDPVEPFQLNKQESERVNKYRQVSEKKKTSIQLVLDNYLDKVK